VLLAEQNVGPALELCESGWWLDAGRIVSRVDRAGASVNAL
jgi:ABC-type branched-subunit amino acid transport system ATPase component